MDWDTPVVDERDLARTDDGGADSDPWAAVLDSQVEIARDYGWLDATMQDGTFLALNTLVANVFSGGSIATETVVPSFALNHRDRRSHVIDAFEDTRSG
ncbi:hypothetical protein SAMN05421752_112139 [Natronorubrum thiooxidans]|uniref:Uncharacterized protein n=1 Tax=Natronorubrum thiooxidans TaxID=308853 RepID=A0A1N7GJ38_9EURY|nr:hypothetical protein SAMN05421752_112139 [Natronorubrum thiooxidans]